jgi:hypothetical protein
VSGSAGLRPAASNALHPGPGRPHRLPPYGKAESARLRYNAAMRKMFWGRGKRSTRKRQRPRKRAAAAGASRQATSRPPAPAPAGARSNESRPPARAVRQSFNHNPLRGFVKNLAPAEHVGRVLRATAAAPYAILRYLRMSLQSAARGAGSILGAATGRARVVASAASHSARSALAAVGRGQRGAARTAGRLAATGYRLMLTGSIQTFYRTRRLLQALAVALPLVLAGLAWWLVNQYVLTPPIPDGSAPAETVVQFIAHEKGLPRLAPAEAEAFLAAQTERIRTSPALLSEFLSVHRTLTAEESQRFSAHMVAVYKPAILRDVTAFLALEADERAAFLDAAIIRYNRAARLWQGVRVNKSMLGNAAARQSDLLAAILSLTTEDERQQAGAFVTALTRRIGEIQADADLQAEFERRIAAPDDQP